MEILSLPSFVDPAFLSGILQVIAIDALMAADNAIIIAIAASSVTPEKRHKVIFFGILAAVSLRIVFAIAATWLMQLPGLLFVGGLLLLFVAYKLFREIRKSGAEETHAGGEPSKADQRASDGTFFSAIRTIVVADVSMSLDNVLAVAGIARDHTATLVFGLAVAALMMAFASELLSKLLSRFPWLAWLGVAFILYIAGHMLVDGIQEIQAFLPTTASEGVRS